MSTLKPKIVLSRLDGTDWTRKGLRPFLEYRDLGLAEATDGRIGGTIGRAIKKFEPGGGAPRRGLIMRLLGKPGHERYLVRWTDEHESIYYPADGAVIVPPAPEPDDDG